MSEDKKLTESIILNEDEMTGVGGGIGRGDSCYFVRVSGATPQKDKDGKWRIKCGFRSCFALVGNQSQCRCHGFDACVDSMHHCDEYGFKCGCAEYE